MLRSRLNVVMSSFALTFLATSLAPVMGAESASVAAASSQPMPRSTPESQGVASAGVVDFLDAVERDIDSLHSFMLIRHGKVVAEGWWGPYDAQTPHMLYSLSKSFTSTAVGLAIAEGKLSVDDEVLKFFPNEAPEEVSPNLKQMRVRDLLRMTTGHESEPPLFRGPVDPAQQGETLTRRFFRQAVPFKPGTHFVYNTPATYMQSAIVQQVTGMTVRDYLVPRLFEPLGIETPQWHASPDGVSAGGFGLFLKTEDIARFGQLYLQRGEWNGTQLIPADWVDAATTRQTSNGSDPNSDWSQGYCFQFWRSRHNSFRGDGAFGQYCLVLPEQDAVIAMTGGLKNMQGVMHLVWEKLLPAMQEGQLPADPATHQKLTAKLAGLTLPMPTGATSSEIANSVSGKWFEFPENTLGMQAMSIEFTQSPANQTATGEHSATLLVRTNAGVLRTPIGLGTWVKGKPDRAGRTGFDFGIAGMLSAPEKPLMAASGAWTEDETFTVKLAPYETPFNITLTIKFDGDQLTLNTEQNVSFGPTKLPQLVGRVQTSPQ